jgi:hypothetical protein
MARLPPTPIEPAQSIYRVSFVKMFYTALKKGATPDPFAEFRAFMLLQEKPPTRLIEINLRNKLEKTLDWLIENVFVFQRDAINQGAVSVDDKYTIERISASKKVDGRLKIEINGFEVEKVDVNEITTMVNDSPVRRPLFKRPFRKMPFNQTLLYVAFFNPDGTLKRDYDTIEIRMLMDRVQGSVEE